MQLSTDKERPGFNMAPRKLVSTLGNDPGLGALKMSTIEKWLAGIVILAGGRRHPLKSLNHYADRGVPVVWAPDVSAFLRAALSATRLECGDLFK
jgi:hypothetical protein